MSEITSAGHNVVGGVAGCTFTAATGDQVGGGANPVIDAKLESLTFNLGPTETHALMAGSPAIDAVPTTACKDLDGVTVDVDQQGLTRPQGTACDSSRRPSVA